MFNRLKHREALPGLAMIFIGLLCFLSCFSIDILEDSGAAARVFPMTSSLLIASLGCLQVLLAPPDSGSNDNDSDILPLASLVALSVAYIFGITYVGYLVATALAAPAALYLFGIRSKPGLALSFVLCPVAFHLVFFVGLGAFPPYGLWFDLLDVIQAG